jgi:L-asparagine transporter-like permease
VDYYDRVKFWVVVIPLWLIALAALAGALNLPENFDIYYRDTYTVFAKVHVILAILLLLVLPLLVLTMRHFLSTRIWRSTKPRGSR